MQVDVLQGMLISKSQGAAHLLTPAGPVPKRTGLPLQKEGVKQQGCHRGQRHHEFPETRILATGLRLLLNGRYVLNSLSVA
jgi:hypothetical protein